MTPDLLKAVAGRLTVPLAQPLAEALDRWWPSYGITTIDRQAIFLAQACHETDGFHTLEEYGNDAYFARYDNNPLLGNDQQGDGNRFHGRGVFQLTGRANYRAYGERLGLDLEGDPSLAAVPDTSVLIACDYWISHGLDVLADQRDMLAITRRINGGYNGLEQRFQYWARAWKALA